MIFDRTFERLFANEIPDLAGRMSLSLISSSPMPIPHLGTESVAAPDIKDVDAIGKFFATPDLNRLSTSIASGNPSDTNTLNIKIAAKLQSDILSQLERDYKLRYRSRIRSMAHEATRRLNHSEKQGPIYSNIIQGVHGFIKLSRSDV